MADTATFSSFRRLAPLRGEPLIERQPTIAVEQAEPPQPTCATPPQAYAPQPELEIETLPPPEMGCTTPAAIAADEPLPTAWRFSNVDLGADQLGLAHPDVILLQANFRGTPPIALEAHTAGIYRPPGFRAAPWSGFAYDQPSEIKTGLAAGTRILTARGEVEVERLVPGDTVMALRGPALLPILWIGRTPATTAPILIELGTIGPDIPKRLLCLGPEQAVFLGPDPVAAHTLVNGTTIRLADAGSIELFHIDVGRAEIILADGLALASSHGVGRRG